MTNMSYCRFRNTLNDLLDCEDAYFDSDLSEEEERARRKMSEVMIRILQDAGCEVDTEGVLDDAIIPIS